MAKLLLFAALVLVGCTSIRDTKPAPILNPVAFLNSREVIQEGTCTLGFENGATKRFPCVWYKGDTPNDAYVAIYEQGTGVLLVIKKVCRGGQQTNVWTRPQPQTLKNTVMA